MRSLFGIAVIVLILTGAAFLFEKEDVEVDDLEITNDLTSVGDLEVLASGLDTVWAIDFLPTGAMIFTERGGRVSVLDEEKVSVVGEIDVSEVAESGLSGIAVDRDFLENNYVYVYYTHSTANRVSRFSLQERRLEDEKILLDGIPSAKFHDGGRIKFGPDDKLYVTTGDAIDPSSAQDLDSLAGKILRINKDGTVPGDNPFGNYVFSYGHRNPQGIVWVEGKLYAAEHGPTRNDEVNLIGKGEDYGWPDKCSDQDSDSVLPIRCYTEFTLAPSGIAYHDGNLFVGGLRGKQVRKLGLDSDIIVEEEGFIDNLGRVREVVVNQGYLYIGTSNKDGRGSPQADDDRILRIKL